jgi:hypothetical protein
MRAANESAAVVGFGTSDKVGACHRIISPCAADRKEGTRVFLPAWPGTPAIQIALDRLGRRGHNLPPGPQIGSTPRRPYSPCRRCH